MIAFRCRAPAVSLNGKYKSESSTTTVSVSELQNYGLHLEKYVVLPSFLRKDRALISDDYKGLLDKCVIDVFWIQRALYYRDFIWKLELGCFEKIESALDS